MVPPLAVPGESDDRPRRGGTHNTGCPSPQGDESAPARGREGWGGDREDEEDGPDQKPPRAGGLFGGVFDGAQSPLLFRKRHRLWVLAAFHVGTSHKGSWTELERADSPPRENEKRRVLVADPCDARTDIEPQA